MKQETYILKKFNTHLFLIILFLAAGAASAQPQAKRASVFLNVEAETPELKRQVESRFSSVFERSNFLSLSLREDAFYQLRVTAITTENGSGRQTGYALASSLSYRSDCLSINKEIFPCYVHVAQYVNVGPPEELAELAGDVIRAIEQRFTLLRSSTNQIH